MNDLSIFHDAFLQRGGAEKVALVWAREFKNPINVLASERKLIDRIDVSINTLIPWIKSQRSLEIIYLFLPVIYKFLRRSKDNVRIVSTTGIAHQLPGTWKKRIVYVHSPTRWIWDKKSFDVDRRKMEIILANIFRPIFKYYDKRSIHTEDIILVNSNATKAKVFSAYGRTSEVIFPPVAFQSGNPRKPKIPDGFERFYLQVGRARGYKGTNFLIDVFRGSGYKLLVVGEGTKKFQTDSVFGLGYVTNEELSWLYESAEALIAVSNEDFGLTPVEAALYGCPTIAFKQEGYLDSVMDGISGKFIQPNDHEQLRLALQTHQRSNYSKTKMISFAKLFSVESHISRIEKYI
jgi:glycosyltransferase involved in cell wall biosynthesis